jgi:hypothetical protein
MARFKVKLKLQGLELEIEGTRDDVPMMSQNLGRQIIGLIQPAADIIEGGPPRHMQQLSSSLAAPTNEIASLKKDRRRKRTLHTSSQRGNGKPDVALDFKHDFEKWGTPKQSWTIRHKTLWLLYIVLQQMDTKELTSQEVTKTFNKHFRQAGTLQAPYVTRELGRAKQLNRPLVGQDSTKSPSTWFLTQAGEQISLGLVSEALGRTGEHQ